MERKVIKEILILFLFLAACQEGKRASNSSDSSLSVSSIDVIDYNSSFVQVRIIGETTGENYVDLDRLDFYTNSDCSSAVIGQALVSEFKSQGANVQVAVNAAVDIYARSQAVGQCVFLQSYSNPALAPSIPTFSAISPMSPSRVTTTPGLFGQATPISSTIRFFSDSNCSIMLSTGSAHDFSQIGIAVPVALNTTTSIYASTLDPLGTPSACTFMTDFTHSNSFSPFPELVSLTPISPSNQSTTPTVRVSSDANAVSVALYSDSGCQNELVSGDPITFLNSGYQITVSANDTTTLYARSIDGANEPSLCALLTTYTHDNISPQSLVFNSADPVSPTNQTTLPRILGFASSDTESIVFYDTSLCLNVIGSGTRVDYNSTGVVANVKNNDTTTVYGKAFDAAGNSTTCDLLTTYVHNTFPPESPVFGALIPNSPSNLTTTPIITGAVADRTLDLTFFKDDLCLIQIGQGTTSEYEGAGVLITADANDTTSIYVQVKDLEGNTSTCFFHASYAHSSTPAPNPSFLSTFPASPSNISSTPSILGSADSSIASVNLYRDNLCSGPEQIGSGSRAQFTSSGIVVTVPNNSTNTVYARALDVFGNYSSCVFLTNYIHNTIAPENPTFTSTTPISPNNQSSSPTILGQALMNIASQLAPVRVDFYDSMSCVSKLGEGTPVEFETTGISINVAENAESSIYARSFDDAGNASACTFLTFYTYNNLVPAAPNFLSTTPGSPSYSPNILITGSYGFSTDFMNRVSLGVFTDSSCTTLNSTHSPILLTTTGVPVTLNLNVTSSLYGQTINEVGTKSACQFLTNFRHYDLAPTNLTATLNTNGTVRLNWFPDTFSSPSPRYNVERSLNSGGPYSLISSSQISNNYTDLQVSNNTTYFYRVYSTNSTGRSQNSTEASILVTAPSPIEVNNLSATISDAEVTLFWSGFPQNMNYQLFRSTQFGGPFEDLGINTTSTSYSDQSLINDQTYYYYIIASNPSGESMQSNIVTATPKEIPIAPFNFTMTPFSSSELCSGAGGLKLAWTAPSYFQSFRVYRGSGKGTTNTIATVSTSSYDDCSFSNDTLYFHRLASNWGSGLSPASGVIGFYSSSPPNLSVNPGSGALNLSWNAPNVPSGFFPGDLRYDIYKSENPDGVFTKIVSGSSTRSFSDTSPNGVGAYYYVQAYLIDGASDTIYVGFPSSTESGRAFSNPTSPTNLVLNYIESDARVQLSWTSPSQYNFFNIYRASNPLGPYNLVTTSSVGALISAPIISGMNYFRVTAVWGGYETPVSNTVEFRHAPINSLSLMAQTTQLNLNWSDVTGVQDYIISRASSINGPFVDYDTSVVSSYSDLGVITNTGYYYRVRARFSDFTQGQKSNIVLGQRLDSNTPSNLSVTITGTTTANLIWPSVNGATNYQVFRALNSSGPFTLITNTLSTNQSVFGLSPQTEYFFKVTATVATNFFDSNVVSAFTFGSPQQPSGLVGNNQVQVFWTAVPGAINYDILRSTDGLNFSTLATNFAMTSFTDLTAANGGLYFYRIIAHFGAEDKASPVSLGFSPGVTPLAPSNLNAENNNTGTEVTLTWSEVSNRNSFNIYRSTTSGSYGAPIQSSNTSKSVRVSGLTSGATYYFRVTALNGSNESAPSNEVKIIPSIRPIKPEAQYLSSNQIQVSWDATLGASTYNLLRSQDGVTFTQVANNLATLNYTDLVSDPSLTYYYRYQPFNSAATEMSVSEISDPVNLSIEPQSPKALYAVVNSSSSVTLNWSSVPNIVGYQLLRSSSLGGPYTQISTPAFNSQVYEDTTVNPGSSYYYVIRGVNSSGVVSSNSNEVGVILVSGPTNLAAVNSTNSINLSWDSIPSVASYNVLRSLTPSGPFGVIGNVSLLNFQDLNVISDTTYSYQVEGVYANGRKTLPSNIVSTLRDGSLRLQVPIELTDTPISSNALTDFTFERTQTSFNVGDYDGVTSYEFEIIAQNSDSFPRAVVIVDSSDAVVDFINIPANTLNFTRFKSSISGFSGSDIYKLQLEQTSSDGQLSVLTAKLLVNQINATKTKLYYPLISALLSPENTDSDIFVASTNQTTYDDYSGSSYWIKNSNLLSKIPAFNAWALEAVVSVDGSSEGQIALQNITNSQLISFTETRFRSTNPILAQIPFNEGLTHFGDGNNGNPYRLVMRCEYYCNTGQVKVHKAGLWVKLTNLSNASVIYRVTNQKDFTSSETSYFEERVQIDSSKFLNPRFYFQALVEDNASSEGVVSLQYHNLNSGNTSLVDYAISERSVNSNSTAFYVTPELTAFPLNQNFVTKIRPTQGELTLKQSSIRVDVGP